MTEPLAPKPLPPEQLALVFDLDGTLVHSLPDLRRAVNILRERRNRPPLAESDVVQMVGDGMPELVRRALAIDGAVPEDAAFDDTMREYVEIYEADPIGLTEPYPGVVETLERLAGDGHPMGVCTNKQEAAARKLLAGLDLDKFFSAVTGGDTAGARKPDPAPLISTIDNMGQNASNAVMIGDSANDLDAAAAAGIPSILVTWGYMRVPPDQLAPTLRIHDMRELRQQLKRLNFPNEN